MRSRQSSLRQRISIVSCIVGLSLAVSANAQGPRSLQLPADQQEKLGTWLLENLIREVIPVDYEDDKKWGTTKEVFNGWDIDSKGLKISTHRKWKRVRHGTWKRYQITMVDPSNQLRFELRNRERVDPVTARTQVWFATQVDARGELQEWQRDMKLLGVSATARADLELLATVRVRSTLDPRHTPPELVIEPWVESAELKMTSFKLTQFSKADGPIIRELGDGLEPLIESVIAEKNQDLPGKLNRAIEKNREKLRFSATGLLQDAWKQLTDS